MRTYFSRQKGEIDGRFLGNREEGGRDDKGLGGGRRRSSFARTNGQTIGYSRRIGFVDDPVIGHTPHTQLAWADTRDTDAATAAANGSSSYRGSALFCCIATHPACHQPLLPNVTNGCSEMLTGLATARSADQGREVNRSRDHPQPGRPDRRSTYQRLARRSPRTPGQSGSCPQETGVAGTPDTQQQPHRPGEHRHADHHRMTGSATFASATVVGGSSRGHQECGKTCPPQQPSAALVTGTVEYVALAVGMTTRTIAKDMPSPRWLLRARASSQSCSARTPCRPTYLATRPLRRR